MSVRASLWIGDWTGEEEYMAEACDVQVTVGPNDEDHVMLVGHAPGDPEGLDMVWLELDRDAAVELMGRFGFALVRRVDALSGWECPACGAARIGGPRAPRRHDDDDCQGTFVRREWVPATP